MLETFKKLFYKPTPHKSSQELVVVLSLAHLFIAPTLLALTSKNSLLVIGLGLIFLLGILFLFNKLGADYTSALFKEKNFPNFLRRSYGRTIELMAIFSTMLIAFLQLTALVKGIILFFSLVQFNLYSSYGLFLVFLFCTLLLLPLREQQKWFIPILMLFGVIGLSLVLIDHTFNLLPSYLKEDSLLFTPLFTKREQIDYGSICFFCSFGLLLLVGIIHPLFHQLFRQTKEAKRAKRLIFHSLAITLLFLCLFYLALRPYNLSILNSINLFQTSPLLLCLLFFFIFLFFVFYTQLLFYLFISLTSEAQNLSFFVFNPTLFGLYTFIFLSFLAHLTLTWPALLALLEWGTGSYLVTVFLPFFINLLGIRPTEKPMIWVIGGTHAGILLFPILKNSFPFLLFPLYFFSLLTFILSLFLGGLATYTIKNRKSLSVIRSLDPLVFLIKKQHVKQSYHQFITYISTAILSLTSTLKIKPRDRRYYWSLGAYIIFINYLLNLLRSSNFAGHLNARWFFSLIGLCFLFYGFYLNTRYYAPCWSLLLTYLLATYSLAGLSIGFIRLLGAAHPLVQATASIHLLFLSFFLRWRALSLVAIGWVTYPLIQTGSFSIEKLPVWIKNHFLFLLQLGLLIYWRYTQSILQETKRRMNESQLRYLERTSQLQLQNLESYDYGFIQSLEGLTSHTVTKLPSEIEAYIQSFQAYKPEDESIKIINRLRQKLKAFSFYWQGAVERIRDVRGLVVSSYRLSDLIQIWVTKLKNNTPYFEAFIQCNVTETIMVNWDEEQLFAVLNNVITMLQHKNKKGVLFFIQLNPTIITYKKTQKKEKGVIIKVSQQILYKPKEETQITIQELLDKKQILKGLSPYHMQAIHNHYGQIRLAEKEEAYEIILPANLHKLTPLCKRPHKVDFHFEKFSEKQVVELVNSEITFWQEVLKQGYAFKKLRKAIIFMMKHHQGQLRKSGVYFYTHPLWVATQIMQEKVSEKMVIASLLHDVVEESHTTLAEIAFAFDHQVAKLVKEIGLLKGSLKERYGSDKYEELHTKKNLRTISTEAFLIKSFDRLHSLQTIHFLTKKSQFHLQEEIQNFYLPLLYALKKEQMAKRLKNALIQK